MSLSIQKRLKSHSTTNDSGLKALQDPDPSVSSTKLGRSRRSFNCFTAAVQTVWAPLRAEGALIGVRAWDAAMKSQFPQPNQEAAPG